MKHSNRQFGDQFSGFGRQSEKFSLSRPDLYLFIRACLHVGGGTQVGEEPQLGEVPRLAVVVYIYT